MYLVCRNENNFFPFLFPLSVSHTFFLTLLVVVVLGFLKCIIKSRGGTAVLDALQDSRCQFRCFTGERRWDFNGWSPVAAGDHYSHRNVALRHKQRHI